MTTGFTVTISLAQWVLIDYSLVFGPDKSGVFGGLDFFDLAGFAQGLIDKLIFNVTPVLEGKGLNKTS